MGLRAVRRLGKPEGDACLYTAQLNEDSIFALLAGDLRKKLEALLDTNTYQYKSDFAKKYIAKGKAAGKIEGKAEARLKILEVKKLSPTQDEKNKIFACQDSATLDSWIERALTLKKVSELFVSPASKITQKNPSKKKP